VLIIFAAAGVLAGCGGLASSTVPQHEALGNTRNTLAYHRTFKYTGARQSFKVPMGVTRITVVARGAAGGGSPYYASRSGRGGRVYAVIPVNPGERLYVFVGGTGFYSSGGVEYGGFNGGGNPGRCCEGGFGGGGASDIRQGGAKLSDRIVVAGGGGGQGGYENRGGAGGSGGGLKGGPGGDGLTGSGFGGGGGHADQRRIRRDG
jgi:hypothetical protein